MAKSEPNRLAQRVAVEVVSSASGAAVGWWWLRQKSSRAELVELGVTSRATSYRYERLVEDLFGKPVSELTEADIRRWFGQS